MSGQSSTTTYGLRRSTASRAIDRESVLRRLDWVLILAVLALCAIGSLLIYSATRGRLLAAGVDPMSYLKRNVHNVAIGLGLATAPALFD